MTNYNERLDEILEALWQYTAHDRLDIGIRPDEAKQAITSLIKELVAEAEADIKRVALEARIDELTRVLQRPYISQRVYGQERIAELKAQQEEL